MVAPGRLRRPLRLLLGAVPAVPPAVPALAQANPMLQMMAKQRPMMRQDQIQGQLGTLDATARLVLDRDGRLLRHEPAERKARDRGHPPAAPAPRA